ncbi:Odorant receptor 061 [Nylanderia fulva]|uniref:Odorant receptor n=2 Tax=Nylanderia fulva TaxID=613905 RepID=A0A6G1LP72_9HYME|nr:Odorant receptor 061 [Nylanderia fulva]
MDTSSDIFQSRQYKLNRILLSMLGQWPFQKERYKRGIFVTVAFIGITQFITQVLALVTLRHNVDVIFEAIAPLLVNSLCVVKITNFIYNTKEIKILLMHVQKDWQSWVIDREFEILHQFAEKGRTITIRYATGIYAFGCLFPFLAIIPKIVGKNVTSAYSTRPVGFPYHVEYFVDLNKYYYPVLIHNYLATSIRLTIIVATDTCTIILIIHCCALFAIIRYRLEHIRISIEQDKRLAFLEEDEKMYKNFVYCIKKHEDAIQFANCVENIFKNALSAEVCITVFMMSLSALQATTETLTPQLAIRHGAYILAQLLLLFLKCWLGQQIIDHSDRVYSSIYRGEWYEASTKSQKLLSMIMLRSSSPSTLTIGKIMVLSLPSYSAIVRASASYFTVLRSVR